MHVQSCCVLIKTVGFWTFPLTLPSYYRKVPNNTVESQLSGDPRGTGKWLLNGGWPLYKASS